MSSHRKGPNPVSRRSFLKTTVANGTAGIAAVAAAGLHPKEAEAADIKWDQTADVVVVGAGVSGSRACAAQRYRRLRDRDRGKLRHRRPRHHERRSIQLGGGHSLQKKYGTSDSADMIFADWTRHDHPASCYSDRDIVRKFADEMPRRSSSCWLTASSSRSRRRWKRSVDERRPDLPDSGMAHPQPARRPSSRPE